MTKNIEPRCAPCRRYAQTAATKVLTNALRAGRKPCAPRRPRGAPHPAPTGLGRRACGGGGFRAARFWPWSVLVGLRAEGTTPLLLLQSVAAGGARWWRFQRRAPAASTAGPSARSAPDRVAVSHHRAPPAATRANAKVVRGAPPANTRATAKVAPGTLPKETLATAKVVPRRTVTRANTNAFQ